MKTDLCISDEYGLMDPHSHVEFLGITGSGKSTLMPTVTRVIPGARTAKESYVNSIMGKPMSTVLPLVHRMPGRVERNVIRAYARLRNVPIYAYHDLLTEYPDFVEAVERVIKEAGVDEPGYIRRLLIRRAIRYGVVMHDNRPIIFDEGFAMTAVALFPRGDEPINEQLIQEYINSVPWPDVIIKVNIDLEQSYRRSQVRSGGLPTHIEALPLKDRKDLIRNMEYCATTLGHLAERSGTTVIEVNNTGTLSQTKRNLEEKLLKIY